MKVKINDMLVEDTDYSINANVLTLNEFVEKGDKVSMSYEHTGGLNRKQRRDIEFGRK